MKRHNGFWRIILRGWAEHVWRWGDASGKTDCGQIVMSWGSLSILSENIQFHVRAKATTIASLFYRRAPCFHMVGLSLLQRVHPNEKITWEVKRVGMWMSAFKWVTWGHVRSPQNIVKLLQSGSELFILCISEPACFLVHSWVQPHGAPEMEAGNGAGKSSKKTNLTWHPHPARGWLTTKLRYVNKV